MKRNAISVDTKYVKRIEKKAKAMIPAKAFLFKGACLQAISIIKMYAGIQREVAIEAINNMQDQTRSAGLLDKYFDELKLAVTDSDTFVMGLHSFYISMNMEFQKNIRLQDEFFQTLLGVKSLGTHKNEIAELALHSFNCLLIGQYEYFNLNLKNSNLMACGRTSYGEIMALKRPCRDVREVVVEQILHPNTPDDVICRRHGIPAEPQNIFSILQVRFYAWYKEVTCLSMVLDEYSYDILPHCESNECQTWSVPNFDISFYSKLSEVQIVREVRFERSKTFPLNGVVIRFNSSSSDFPVRRILMKEVSYPDRVFLLYKIETPTGEFSGFFDLKTYTCTDAFLEFGADERSRNNILWMIIYLYLCEVGRDAETLQETILHDMVFIKSRGEDEEPTELFPYQVHFQSLGNKKENVYQPGKNNSVPDKIRTSIVKGHPSKLREGSRRSEAAVNLAESLGIKLKPNYTYVREHERLVHYKDRLPPWENAKRCDMTIAS